MKIPGRELAMVLVGLAALVAAWLFVFTATQRRWRTADAASQPAAVTTEAEPDAEAPRAEESAGDVLEKPGEKPTAEPGEKPTGKPGEKPTGKPAG